MWRNFKQNQALGKLNKLGWYNPNKYKLKKKYEHNFILIIHNLLQIKIEFDKSKH